MLGGGFLDFFSKYRAQEPVCLSTCPAGSIQAYQSCVAPEAANWGADVKEVLIVVHVPCEGCDQAQAAVAGWLWLGVARLLHVPLQEMVAAALLVSSKLRSQHALEHFTQRTSLTREIPLIADDGQTSSGPPLGPFDLYLALRIHTKRLGSDQEKNNQEYKALLKRDARPLAQALGASGSIFIFEAVERKSYWNWGLDGLVPTFKLYGLQWDERPNATAQVDKSGANSTAAENGTLADLLIGPTALSGMDATAPTAVDASRAASASELIASYVLFGEQGAATQTMQAAGQSGAGAGAATAASMLPAVTLAADEAAASTLSPMLIGIIVAAAVVVALLLIFLWRKCYMKPDDDSDPEDVEPDAKKEKFKKKKPSKLRSSRDTSTRDDDAASSSSDGGGPGQQNAKVHPDPSDFAAGERPPAQPRRNMERRPRNLDVTDAGETGPGSPVERSRSVPGAERRAPARLRSSATATFSFDHPTASATFNVEFEWQQSSGGSSPVGRRRTLNPNAKFLPTTPKSPTSPGATQEPSSPATSPTSQPTSRTCSERPEASPHGGQSSGSGGGVGGGSAEASTPQAAALAEDAELSEHHQHAIGLIAEMTRQMDLARGAPIEVRRRLFKELQKKMHPDKNINDPEAAKLAFQHLMDSRASFLVP